MWVTGRVRDRVERGRGSGDGGNDFCRGLPRQKWWGPVVLDAAPKPASGLATSRERPLPTVAASALRPASQTVFLHATAMAESSAEGTNGQRKD